MVKDAGRNSLRLNHWRVVVREWLIEARGPKIPEPERLRRKVFLFQLRVGAGWDRGERLERETSPPQKLILLSQMSNNSFH